MPAKMERCGDLSDVWRVIVDGRTVVDEESYGVASAIVHTINHPERWEPTEAYEIADAIRRQS